MRAIAKANICHVFRQHEPIKRLTYKYTSTLMKDCKAEWDNENLREKGNMILFSEQVLALHQVQRDYKVRQNTKKEKLLLHFRPSKD